jgi:hypothetical protein
MLAAVYHALWPADGGYNSSRPNSDGGSGSKGSINGGDAAGTIAAASGQWMAALRNANERFVMVRSWSGVVCDGVLSCQVPVAGYAAQCQQVVVYLLRGCVWWCLVLPAAAQVNDNAVQHQKAVHHSAALLWLLFRSTVDAYGGVLSCKWPVDGHNICRHQVLCHGAAPFLSVLAVVTSVTALLCSEALPDVCSWCCVAMHFDSVGVGLAVKYKLVPHGGLSDCACMPCHCCHCCCCCRRQIGNIFSGLFLSIHSNNAVAAAGLTTIRKPALPAETHATAATATTITAAADTAATEDSSGQQQQLQGSIGSSSKAVMRRRSWMERPYLKQKLTDGAAAVKVTAHFRFPTVAAG